jgi:hypothetical protein
MYPSFVSGALFHEGGKENKYQVTGRTEFTTKMNLKDSATRRAKQVEGMRKRGVMPPLMEPTPLGNITLLAPRMHHIA